jgi:hypothetical protein
MQRSSKFTFFRFLSGIIYGYIALGMLVVIGCSASSHNAIEAALKRGDLSAALSAYDHDTIGDLALLARIASLVLERESTSKIPALRDAALAALQMNGTASVPVLERLSKSPKATVAQARALRILMTLGDHDARDRLRTLLDISDPDIAAEALWALEPRRDLKRILQALELIYSVQRLQAARLLAQAAPDSAARQALIETARTDPSVEVRAAAVGSLASFGDAALEAIEAALVDREPRIRLAAVNSLARANRARGARVLEKHLDTDPSDVAIEAARWLAASDPGDKRIIAPARDLLVRALSSSDPALRARAAVALQTLPPVAEEAPRLAELLKQEHLPSVRFWLALTIQVYKSEGQRARAALNELMKTGGVFGAQAAAQLAKQGDREALNALLELRASSSVVRGTAAALIAVDLKRPLDARRYLSDKDAGVRIAAAGAILTAAHR